MTEPLASIRFQARAIEWRGPAPYLFVPIPEEHVGGIRYAARFASYGWGAVPVEAEIEGITFATSLFPRNDGYLLPIKVAVQQAAGIGIGDAVTVLLEVRSS